MSNFFLICRNYDEEELCVGTPCLDISIEDVEFLCS